MSDFKIFLNRILTVCLAIAAVAVFSPELVGQDRESRQDEWRRGGRGRGETQDGEGRRGGFDPMSFLKRMDANGDGQLTPEETSDRTKRYLESLGINPDSPIALDKLEEKITNRGSGKSESPSTVYSAANVERKVPGFGVDASKMTPPPSFGAEAMGATVSTSVAGGQYSKEIMEQVEMTLARYDRNKDGIIDAEEIKSVRWSAPNASEADLNGDGILTQAEIAERYLKRERASSEMTATTSSERTDSRGNRDGGFRRREESTDNSREATRTSEESNRSSNSSRGSVSDREKALSYAKGFMEMYDKNKDGQLDAEEFKAVRRPPPNADRNGDGLVSLSELEEAFLAVDSGEGTGSESSGSEPSSERRSSIRSGGSRERGSSGSSGEFSFFDKDLNRDRQIQMHEFAEKWTDQLYEQFQAMDRNKDGVITYEEYEAFRRGGAN